MQGRRWIAIGVVIAIGIVAAVAWSSRSGRALTAERLERKLATQVCRRVAECEPQRWGDAYHNSFDACIADVSGELADALGVCTTDLALGRPCIKAIRAAPCDGPWTAARVRAACPALSACP
ncbi:MAG: Flp pilus assembly protein TadB [Myxococcota bacterium]|jgi:Flp pilus assembly protein TadB